MKGGDEHNRYKGSINLPQTPFAMKADLPRREPGMLADWEKRDRYAALQQHTAAREHAFILHDGPPYANGAIHLGHAVNKILKDIVVRSKLLSGFRSPYVPGWDCHGLPIEIAVEKKHGKVGQKVDAATFRKLCREYAAKQIDLQRADFKRLGVLGEWSNPYRTMDFRYEADMLRALAKIHARGHVTRGFKPVYWCFDCGSALAEAEIEYQDKTSPAVDVAYDAIDPAALAAQFGAGVGEGDIVAVPIWTTTPWTLPASFAVTLGPELDYVLAEGPRRGDRRVLLVVAEALAERVLARYGVDSVKVLGRAKGADLEHQLLQHPFYETRQIPLILGEHVSAEDGTGAVHTAPGHGAEDFAVGKLYGIVDAIAPNELNPVGGNGVYLPGTPIFAGQYIWKANDAIIELLRERGVLLAHAKINHSYPHCWRHKTPVAFRTTPQWFIGMEQAGLRADSLKAIHEDVRWFPGWGEERIAKMVEGRPDWCISRQRTWGVPIALFVDKADQQPHPRSVELMEQVALRVEQEGADAWYALDARELLGDEADRYEKVTDILDVWFDSGVTHFCVLDQRENLRRKPGDKVIYLEGSDQHRGWFHSSLLTSVAMRGRAPYDEVLTHGFTVDEQGRKMSKSLGNGIEPQDVMKDYGADILRLWIASADYRNEMALSPTILKRVADAYRRIRNTARFLLGNLHGFDPARHLLPAGDCLLLDQWAVQQAFDAQQAIVAAYARYDFPEIVQRVQNFCTNEMGSLYLDITKDRLYTMREDSRGRRSAQSAMYRIAEAMVRWLAPMLAFTAEEIWQLLPGMDAPMPRAQDAQERRPGERGESVLFQTWYEGLEAMQGSDEQRAFWNDLLAIRAGASKLLEGMRNAGAIGAALDAEVTLHADAAQRARYAAVADELRFFFIASEVRFVDGALAADAEQVDVQGSKVGIHAVVSTHRKCIRCWHHRPDVGANAQHPDICGRCVENVDGAGEDRRWF
ncbi:MAG: isoleucine--tRNA ligase [Proteobacteria bacterium]|nr:isoleucine--tRNA ligase [Pseudomonadota bacterium]